MQRRSSATWLALCYAVLVVYASLYPFWPWRMPPSLPWPGVIGLPWPRYWGRFDLWINVAGYWPLGLLCFSAVIRSGGGLWRALLLTLVGLPLLSFAMETLQYFLPGRVPSLADFLLNSAGALALLALWPVGLLYPAPLPLGLGQLFPRLREWAELLLENTPWELVPKELADDPPLPPGLEAIAIAMGLLAPCLLALSLARPGRQRAVLILGAVAIGVTTTAWSTLLNFGPDHAWAWLTPTTEPGLIAGGVLALLAAFMSRRANAAWGLVVLTALIALMAEAPSDPYLLESLQFWEQGRFVNLYGLAQWVGWLWPFAALAWLLYGVTQSDRPPPPRSPPGGRSEGQAGRDGTHERPVGGNPETTIP